MAKQFMDNTDGDIEIDNLEAVNEIADWGYDRNRGLWAIVNKGDGVKLRQLPSFQNRVISMRRGIEGCREYMGLIRDGIVEESTKYFEMRGAPMHGFVQLISPSLIHVLMSHDNTATFIKETC